jgi:hypothetical protein
MLPVLNACAQARVSIATFRIRWNLKPGCILRAAAAARYAMIMGDILIQLSGICLFKAPRDEGRCFAIRGKC